MLQCFLMFLFLFMSKLFQLGDQVVKSLASLDCSEVRVMQLKHVFELWFSSVTLSQAILVILSIHGSGTDTLHGT